MKRFTFKTTGEIYYKERIGLKPNTVRKIDLNDDRFLDLISIAYKGFNDNKIEIKIIHAQTKDYFIREIEDVTIWDNLMIISWKHKLTGEKE